MSARNCPNCNSEVPADSTFCNSCGSRLGEDSQALAEKPKEEIKPTTESRVEPRRPYGMLECPHCKSIIKPKHRFSWIFFIFLLLTGIGWLVAPFYWLLRHDRYKCPACKLKLVYTTEEDVWG